MNQTMLKLLIVIFGLSFIFSITMLGKVESESRNQKEVISKLTKQVDSLQKFSDSLHWELLPVEIELGRYRVAFEIFSERNPKAAEQYGTIISNETE
jgi:predicted metalloenzyme YecM